jgi:type VI secretion system secreted protein Hcp
MAETVHLYLKANGTDIKGESTQTSQGRADSIEVIQYEHSVETAREAGSGMATGRRTYKPIKITKRIDKSTPLIAKALVENTVVDGIFKFFRPSPLGDGTTQQYYTVAFKQGRVSGLTQNLPNTFDPASSKQPPLETIEFVFHTISWTFTDGGVTHEDTWSGNR